jgi:hypothetical protein
MLAKTFIFATLGALLTVHAAAVPTKSQPRATALDGKLFLLSIFLVELIDVFKVVLMLATPKTPGPTCAIAPTSAQSCGASNVYLTAKQIPMLPVIPTVIVPTMAIPNVTALMEKDCLP